MDDTRPRFHVVQTTLGSKNDLGEMTETEVYAHVRTRLGCGPFEMENIFFALAVKGVFTALFVEGLGNEVTMEIRRL